MPHTTCGRRTRTEGSNRHCNVLGFRAKLQGTLRRGDEDEGLQDLREELLPTETGSAIPSAPQPPPNLSNQCTLRPAHEAPNRQP